MIQLSGVIISEETLEELPFVTVFNKTLRKGVISDYYGYFSLVTFPGDTIVFANHGFKKSSFIIPDTLKQNRYSLIHMIPADTFHKICRFMSEWSENIEIKCVDSQLTLSCEGDTVDQATTIGQSTDGLVFERNDNPEKIIEGVFSLKYLILFTKCSKLCEVIHVHLQNDLPLTIVYKIGLIGDIKLCLAPNPSDE
jgi:hypothetical protein